MLRRRKVTRKSTRRTRSRDINPSIRHAEWAGFIPRAEKKALLHRSHSIVSKVKSRTFWGPCRDTLPRPDAPNQGSQPLTLVVNWPCTAEEATATMMLVGRRKLGPYEIVSLPVKSSPI